MDCRRECARRRVVGRFCDCRYGVSVVWMREVVAEKGAVIGVVGEGRVDAWEGGEG